ncbi:Hcp family type VI secretion system effector [Desulfonema magnum]|uniref:Type VI secretion protein domain-containing protein, Hcp-like n=1 Tax=Desulfonema magnum TaxID=45655 RepID=A0A975GLN1_9BACT|nr:type VI secretion system tube protein Hcp [Desulfonema magnum]QTA85799.1 Type VI secretion protein domain-containing protein, Hcp-like [Desulfonema magnum]
MASNMLLKLDTIDGESTDAVHAGEGWIEILSWSHGFTQPTTPVRASSGSTTEMCNHSDVSVTKYLDKATDQILNKVWSGKQLAEAHIECYRSDGNNNPVKYLQIDMEKVIISNYNISGGGGDVPMENLSLSYGKVTYNYIQYDNEGNPQGVQPVSHDLTTNEVG